MKILYDYFTHTYLQLPNRYTKLTVGHDSLRSNHVRLPILDEETSLDELVRQTFGDDDPEQSKFFQKMVANSIGEVHAVIKVKRNQVKLYDISSIGTKVKRGVTTIYIPSHEGVVLEDNDQIFFGHWHINYHENGAAKQIASKAKKYKIRH